MQTLKKITVIILILIASGFIKGQCSANFIYSNVGGGVINFTSTSTGTTLSTKYIWNFGNGYPSGPGTPTISLGFYNGIYIVTLTTLDTISLCTSSIAITLTVTNSPCTGAVSFYYWPFQNGGVSFINTTSGLWGYSWAWAFGDGGTSNSLSPSHTYTASGVYNVTVTATDQLSICSYTAVQSCSITVGTCSLNSVFTYTIGLGGNVNFTSISTGTSPTASYYWNFGDFSGSTSMNPTHTYSSNGTYNVYLNVKDSINFSCYSTSTQTINFNSPCIANVNFTMAKDSSALPAIVWAAIPNYPINILAADWSWGDGSNTLALYPSHTYSAAGLYSICVTVTTACSATASSCSNTNVFKTSLSNEANMIAKVNVKQPLAIGIKNNFLESSGPIIYPNPNNGEFTLKISEVQEQSIVVKIFNIFGQKVYELIETNISGEINKKIDLNELSGGTYFVRINFGNGTTTKKILIAK